MAVAQSIQSPLHRPEQDEAMAARPGRRLSRCGEPRQSALKRPDVHGHLLKVRNPPWGRAVWPRPSKDDPQRVADAPPAGEMGGRA